MLSIDTIVWSDPARMGGIPCFIDTRVPIRTLFDYLAAGSPLDEFLDDFPTVSREHAQMLLHVTAQKLDTAISEQTPPDGAMSLTVA